MAWTNPRTWTDGELVTKAIMDTHIKGNFDVTWHNIAKKAGDESVTSSTTLQDDNDLNVTVGTTEKWHLEWRLYVTGNATGDFKMGWTFPASGTFAYLIDHANTTGTQTLFQEVDTSSPTGAVNIGILSTQMLVVVHAYYTGGGTAGTVTLQWAQSTSDATATIVKAGSIVNGMLV